MPRVFRWTFLSGSRSTTLEPQSMATEPEEDDQKRDGKKGTCLNEECRKTIFVEVSRMDQGRVIRCPHCGTRHRFHKGTTAHGELRLDRIQD